MIKIIKTHKIKIIVVTAILAVLAFAWFYDGMTNSRIIHPIPESNEVETETDDLYYYELDCYDESDDEYTADELDQPDEVEETPVVVSGTTTPNTEHDTTHPVASEHLAHPAARTPIEPENMVRGDGSFTVTLSVRVDMLLHNMHLLHRDKHELVPEDGIIFPATQVTAFEGESVFNVLQREMRRHGIHMSSRFTPVFNSAYIEAINNIFEFDGGPLSGWMYRVNGWFPNFGASRYLLQPGDVIEWMYTVDLGRDVGGYFLSDGAR